MNVTPGLSHWEYNTRTEWSGTCWGILGPKKK